MTLSTKSVTREGDGQNTKGGGGWGSETVVRLGVALRGSSLGGDDGEAVWEVSMTERPRDLPYALHKG